VPIFAQNWSEEGSASLPPLGEEKFYVNFGNSQIVDFGYCCIAPKQYFLEKEKWVEKLRQLEVALVLSQVL
jgi:hypothetical protein